MADLKATNASTENLYMQLNASELSAIIMKGSPHSNDRDAGFCSGSSEGGDDCSIDHLRMDPSSPTDASEDSVEVKVMPISLVRNKRKSSEPSKVVCERKQLSTAQSHGPLKKRIRYTSNTDSAVVLTPPTMTVTSPSPHLWDPSQVLPHEFMPNPAQVFVRHPGVTTLHRAPVDFAESQEQEEPLALVLRKPTVNSHTVITAEEECTKTLKSPKSLSPKKRLSAAATREDEILQTPETFTDLAALSSSTASTSNSVYNESALDPSVGKNSSASTTKPQQRNYKNMTRERRIEANARERSRVHTISAAYETLRRSVPSYSSNQKLSKLSVLRVACSYILTLSRMAGYDYSKDQCEPSIASCFDAVTATIQTEGKIRKKKDE
ncbi:protein atonal homolog 8 [Glossina fuscipes]|uniref:Protein atonal homolog 8 n=1 Tax=Glossina fuscipes TaxID=7396 RepID=A0A9C5YYW8_9MUSC|nr:protein atonal homolog 8 [Glossina fuscipes]